MADISLPDGSVVTFPDDMPEGDMAKALSDHVEQQAASYPAIDPNSGLSATPEQAGANAQLAGGIGKFATTAAVRGLGGLANFAADPIYAPLYVASPSTAQAEHSIGGAWREPGTQIGNALFNYTGIPEYKPESAGGRIGLTAAEGAVAGAPFGVAGALIGGLGGLTGQSTKELTGSDRAAMAAALLPAFGAKPTYKTASSFFPEQAAASTLRNLAGRDEPAGGLSIDALRQALEQSDTIRQGLTPKPLSISDVAGPTVQGRAEALANQPGEAAATAEAFLRSRDAGAGPRLLTDLNESLGTGPTAYRTAQSLAQQRATEAAPLYQKAFEGGSIAPLEDSLTKAFNDASATSQQAAKDVATAQQAMTAAQAKGATAGNVYSSSAASTAQQDAAAQLAQAQRRAAGADQAKAQTLDLLRTAQDHAANGVPGAVWTPRIQQFLDDPIIQQGINKGIQVQRLESLASGTPFDPREFAITGFGQDGSPIVSKVPNMRLLDAGKRGLDDILEQYRDPTTGVLRLDQYGRAVDQVRQSFLGELDRVNPDYASARAAWSGPSQTMSAMKQGASIFNMQPEQISDAIGRLNPGDKPFFQIGARDALAQRIASTSAGGNEALRIVGNQQIQNQLRPLFPDDKSYNAFIGQAQLESGMYRNFNNTLGNSRTFRRASNAAAMEAEGAPGALGSALAAGAGFAAHEPFAAVPALMRTLRGASNWLTKPSPAVEAAMGRMLWSGDPATNAATLNAMSNARGLAPLSLSGGAIAPLGLIAGESYR